MNHLSMGKGYPFVPIVLRGRYYLPRGVSCAGLVTTEPFDIKSSSVAGWS